MRFGRLVLVSVASLLALAVADAAAATGYPLAISLVAHNSGFASAYILVVTVLGCVTAVAGVLYAIFVLARHLPRGLLVAVGLVPVLMLAFREYLLTYPAAGGGMAQIQRAADVFTGYGVLTPTVAGAVLGVAIVAIALTRRPFPRYESPLRAASPEFAGAGATVLSALAAVGVWLGAGFAEVLLITPNGLNVYRFSVTFDGHVVPSPSIASGPVWVMLAVGTVCVLIAGGLYPVLVSRRLHPAVPLVIAAAYILPTMLAVAATLARHGGPRDGPLPGVQVVAATEVAVAQPAVTGAALLLAVPLIVAGVVRLRERANRPAPVPSDEPRVTALV